MQQFTIQLQVQDAFSNTPVELIVEGTGGGITVRLPGDEPNSFRVMVEVHTGDLVVMLRGMEAEKHGEAYDDVMVVDNIHAMAEATRKRLAAEQLANEADDGDDQSIAGQNNRGHNNVR